MADSFVNGIRQLCQCRLPASSARPGVSAPRSGCFAKAADPRVADRATLPERCAGCRLHRQVFACPTGGAHAQQQPSGARPWASVPAPGAGWRTGCCGVFASSYSAWVKRPSPLSRARSGTVAKPARLSRRYTSGEILPAAFANCRHCGCEDDSSGAASVQRGARARCGSQAARTADMIEKPRPVMANNYVRTGSVFLLMRADLDYPASQQGLAVRLMVARVRVGLAPCPP